jgi:hypothetical protein
MDSCEYTHDAITPFFEFAFDRAKLAEFRGRPSIGDLYDACREIMADYRQGELGGEPDVKVEFGSVDTLDFYTIRWSMAQTVWVDPMYILRSPIDEILRNQRFRLYAFRSAFGYTRKKAQKSNFETPIVTVWVAPTPIVRKHGTSNQHRDQGNYARQEGSSY